ncbi:MAG: hypothetical protein K2X64_11625, partial [Rhodocyclaceae bacterium]|nr:hypothetical protein [Rhodocyclaceae bacterium]
MKELLNELGFDAETDPRYINSEQGLRLLEASSADREVLADIVSQVSKACQKEMKDRNRLLPLAFLLGQAVLKAEDAGVEISSETRSVLETGLAQVGASMRDVIRTVSTAKPSAKDVLGMFNRLERSMFASDVARDYAVLGLAARRLLDVEQHTAPDESTFAIELLADHTVSLPGATPAMALDWPAQYAAELNRAGLEVVFLALDSQGELVVTHISGGVVRAI